MNYQMRLQKDPFEKIKSGAKTVERRLNDPKRQLLKIGDTIDFVLAQDPTQTVKVRVIDLALFKTFRELSEVFPPSSYAVEANDQTNYMSEYYSKEDEEKYGVLAIKIELI